MTSTPIAADWGGLDRWFHEHVPGYSGNLTMRVIPGGRSNLTYRATDSGDRTWVVRRPPPGPLLPRAHDVAREHRVLDRLGRSGLPVPAVHGLCEDSTVIGAPFYVMDLVEGLVIRDRSDAESDLPSEGRCHTGRSLAAALAQLHALSPSETGLGDLGRPDGYLGRQLRRWNDQYCQARDEMGGPDVPEIDAAHAMLTRSMPESQGASVVHGDYKLDNVLIDRDGTVLAILDWELCTLGDPLADLGTLLAYWEQGDDDETFTDDPATAAPGFVTRAEVAEEYGRVSGRSVADIDYYVALGYWKIACIAEGVYARYASGVMEDDGYDHRDAPRRIEILGRKSIAALTAWQSKQEKTS